MNVISDPGSEGFGIIVDDSDDITVCRRALGPTTISYEKILSMYRVKAPALIDAEVSEAVARGLAYISLGYFGSDGFAGITQEQADQKITALFGDIESVLVKP